MIVVCDANVLVRAVMSPAGPAAALMELLDGVLHQLATSTMLLDETRRILQDPRLKPLHRLEDAAIDDAIRAIASLASFVVVPANVPRVVPADPFDDHVIYVAEMVAAEVICTRDRHFHAPPVTARCAQRGIRIVDDVALLSDLRSPP